MILSVSRRTDIPAFYMDWFLNRQDQGYVLTKNPMNPKQVSRIDFDKVSAYVFWTKDPHNLLVAFKKIKKPFLLQVTITPYLMDFEAVRDKKRVIEDTIKLSQLIGHEKITWRYDPIVFTDKYDEAYHLKYFEKLCSYFQGHLHECVISFVEVYRKVKKALSHINKPFLEDRHSFVMKLKEIAGNYQIKLKACGEELPIEHASCIDEDKLKGIGINGYKKDKSQRPTCHCIESIDIGSYNTCIHHCLYCYANHNHAQAKGFYNNFDQKSEILGSLNGDEVIRNRQIKRSLQISLDLD